VSDPSAPIRVAHIEMGSHLYGGAQQVLYLLEALSSSDVTSTLICPVGSAIGKAARERGVAVEEVGYRGDLDWVVLPKIKRLLRQRSIDLVHVHSRRGADVWGGLAARQVGLPCVISRRVDHHEAWWWAGFKYALCDHVIAISEGIRAVLLADGVSAEKVSCVRSAVDFERFQTVSDSPGVKARFGLPDDSVVVGMAAQLIPRKGHDVLLEAVSALKDRWPQLRVLIMGKGPLATSVAQQIEAMDLEEQVRCVGFLTDIETVLPHLAFLVHPARTEGLGVALLQAASAGLAVIASRAGGMPEAVLDEETGILIPPGDAQALVAAMERLLSGPALANEYGAAGRRRMADEFSINAMAVGNLSVYRRLISSRRDA
jgi:glycosyltransferase involved in cell wall biosynthesis